MTRRTIFVISHKANMPSLAEAKKYYQELMTPAASFMHEVIICPSFVHLETAMNMSPSTVRLGAQDCSQYSNGPFTGEVTASVLADLGVKYCIVGHMERRALGDTDQIINKKVKQLLASGITPVIVVGENLAEYNNNMTRVIIERQMMDILSGVKEWDRLIFCYQPAWSIGTGHYTSGEYTDLIVDFMRKTLQKISGLPAAGNIPVLYGGGVTLSNIKEYLECPQVDGIMSGLGTIKADMVAQIVGTKFTMRGGFGQQ
ncbi:MAG: triose-phosphate isomerase [Firmicutes bacterium]|nr:triose-phosphate isomerase [Bacillota bacterium]